MNPIRAAITDAAEDICKVLEEISSEVMLNQDIEISDRITIIKSALYLRKFLDICLTDDPDFEDWDLMNLFPLLKDYDDGWCEQDYIELAEKFVPWAEAEGAENW
jgi:hypothetical protein